MNRLEARIRDYLADHISLLERGLTLVAKEYELKNKLGSGGFVDILARDQLGHLVVIELKRSDQTARSAIHEITKYVALLRADQGVGREQIRAMLLSTEWNELALPFSDYLKICEVPTEGIVIAAEESGAVTSVTPFIAIETAQPLTVSRCQDIVLFSNAQVRDEAVSRVAAAATRSGLSDFVVLRADYKGSNPEVVFPHAIYLVFSSPFQTMSADAIKIAKKKIRWDNDLDEPDENFLIAFRTKLGALGDSSEIGTPEKLASMLLRGWKVMVSHRSGRYAANRMLLSDDQLIREATKVEGGGEYYITRTASPKYPPSWHKLRKDINLVLLGDDAWQSIVSKILAQVGQSRPNATVSLHIYQPARIVFGLVKLFGLCDSTYLPSLQLVVADADEIVVYCGTLGWNGKPVAISGEQWITEVFGSLWEFAMQQHFGLVHEQEVAARKKVGLESFVIEVHNPGGKNEQLSWLSMCKGRLVRNSMDTWTAKPMAEFASRNPGFGASLVTAISQLSTGWT